MAHADGGGRDRERRVHVDGTDTERATIARLEESRYRAMLLADVATLTALLADGAVYTHSNAERDTKTSYIEKVATGRLKYLEIMRPEEHIVMAGNTAVVAGRMVADVLVGGLERHLDNRCLAVWAFYAERWQLLAFQGTVIAAA